MTRVDFYVLPDDSEAQRVDMACRLAEKAVKQSKKVFIHTDSEQLADTIDKALWQFRDDAFVPHRSLPAVPDQQAGQLDGIQEPVEIGCGCQPEDAHSVLINLGAEVPPFFSRFERTLEIINQQQHVRSSGRTRYSYYQQRGYPLHHHKM